MYNEPPMKKETLIFSDGFGIKMDLDNIKEAAHNFQTTYQKGWYPSRQEVEMAERLYRRGSLLLGKARGEKEFKNKQFIQYAEAVGLNKLILAVTYKHAGAIRELEETFEKGLNDIPPQPERARIYKLDHIDWEIAIATAQDERNAEIRRQKEGKTPEEAKEKLAPQSPIILEQGIDRETFLRQMKEDIVPSSEEEHSLEFESQESDGETADDTAPLLGNKNKETLRHRHPHNRI